jgi:hypothetical protein
MGKFQYEPGQPVKVSYPSIQQILSLLETVQKMKQKSQKIPNRLFGAQIIRDEAI